MESRTFELSSPLDLWRTCGLHRRGPGDPTMRVSRTELVKATRAPEGLGTLHLRVAGTRLEAAAWGPGAGWMLDRVPELVGEHDDPSVLVPEHPVVRDLQKRAKGFRVGRSLLVLDALIPGIMEQKVTSHLARRSFRLLTRAVGETAPGPFNLRVFPAPEVLAAKPYHFFHRYGLERRRADIIRMVCARAALLERTAGAPFDAAYKTMTTFRGIGPWTAAEVGIRAFGDPDAVSVGDLHLPHLVTWVLAGEPRGDDERMLELLQPYAGQRGRVVRLIELGASGPPRRAPRYEGNWVAGF